MSKPLYSSGKIKGEDWKQYLSDAGPVFGRLSEEERKQLYDELRKIHIKYTHPTNPFELMIMQENKARGTIGDGYVSEKAYLALEKSVR